MESRRLWWCWHTSCAIRTYMVRERDYYNFLQYNSILTQINLLFYLHFSSFSYDNFYCVPLSVCRLPDIVLYNKWVYKFVCLLLTFFFRCWWFFLPFLFWVKYFIFFWGEKGFSFQKGFYCDLWFKTLFSFNGWNIFKIQIF